MAIESITGSFAPNGSSAVNNGLNKAGSWSFSVERLSTGLFRVSCENFYTGLSGFCLDFEAGTNLTTDPGYRFILGASSFGGSSNTHDVLVFDGTGERTDISFVSGQFITFDFEVSY